MKKRIERVIEEVEKRLKEGDSYIYLPGILEGLLQMKNEIFMSRSRRFDLGGGLGYLVLDDMNFAESALGDKLAHLLNDYASCSSLRIRYEIYKEERKEKKNGKT